MSGTATEEAKEAQAAEEAREAREAKPATRNNNDEKAELVVKCGKKKTATARVFI